MEEELKKLKEAFEAQKKELDALKASIEKAKKDAEEKAVADKAAADKLAADKAAAESGNQSAGNEKKKDEDFKTEAGRFFVSLSEDERKKATQAVEALADDVKVIVESSYEAKLEFLQGLFPDKKKASKADGGIFDSLIPTKQMSIKDQIAAAVKGLTGRTPATRTTSGADFNVNGDSNKVEATKPILAPGNGLSSLAKK